MFLLLPFCVVEFVQEFDSVYFCNHPRPHFLCIVGAYYLAAQECEAVARELLAQQVKLLLSCMHGKMLRLVLRGGALVYSLKLMLYDTNFHIPPFFFLSLLSFSQAELRTNGVAPFSLLSQPSVVQRLQAEGSAFVTSNFLFSEPHLQQGMRVATIGKEIFFLSYFVHFLMLVPVT